MKRFLRNLWKTSKPAVLASVTGAFIFACMDFAPRFTADKGDSGSYSEAIALVKGARDPERRMTALGKAALESARLDKLEEAERFARELEAMSPTDGDVLEDLHTALGLAALKRGDVGEAKARLLASGRAPGTPVRGSFGPTMLLAKALLKSGEKETVLQYFDLCGGFWSFHRDKLNEWTRDVKRGIPPDFRYNI